MIPPRHRPDWYMGTPVLSTTSFANAAANTQESLKASTVKKPRLAQHNQDLVDVMLELEHLVGPRVDLVFQMGKMGHVHDLNEEEPKSCASQA